jgi:hypothetical protein
MKLGLRNMLIHDIFNPLQKAQAFYVVLDGGGPIQSGWWESLEERISATIKRACGVYGWRCGATEGIPTCRWEGQAPARPGFQSIQEFSPTGY